MTTADKDFKVKNGLVVTDGGTFGGPVVVSTPTQDNHAATKLYVDSNAGGGGGGYTVSDTAPESPSEGDVWFRSTDAKEFIYYDSYWVELVQGPQGEQGVEGSPGVASATSPITYDTETKTVGIDESSITVAQSQVTDLASDLASKVDETNGAVTTADTGSNVVRNITLSTSQPTGGSDGDVWLVYTA